MLKIDLQERENIAVITPDSTITGGDLDHLTNVINDYINEYDQIPNLVIHATHIPHWSSFGALEKHLAFVKNHHRLVKKVAIVSDSKLLWIAKTIVDHFTGAKIRRFEEDAIDDAMAWAKIEDDHPGDVLVMEGFPDDVIGLDFRGLITAKDYEQTIIPLVESKIESKKTVKLLAVFGTYFDGYSAGAMWDDLSIGLKHLTSFDKIAIVTDEEWLRHSTKFFAFLMPSQVMVFSLSELDQAKDWITQ